MMAVLISLTDILDYIGYKNGHRRRCMIEGEAVFNAKHIICCGVIKKTENRCEILSLCLQTSNLAGNPHEINVVVERGAEVKLNGVCSCKAGNSGQCKHIIATLIYINRTAQELEDLSCTDIRQAWGEVKGRIANYKPVNVQSFCHVKAPVKPNLVIGCEQRNLFLQDMINSIPDSALSKHFHGRNNLVNDPNIFMAEVNNPTEITEIFQNGSAGNLEDYYQVNYFSVILCENLKITLQKKNIFRNLEDKELNFFQKNVQKTINECTNICLRTVMQNNSLWKYERRIRITGSTCYHFYTFVPDRSNWESKIDKELFKTFCGNIATRHGKYWEKFAKEKYAQEFCCCITNIGLYINEQVPWLAYSADGIVFNNDLPKVLLEIKCPLKGKEVSGNKLLEKLLYVEKNGENFTLKSNHAYYGQVQLGMALLNLKKCHFVIFSSKDQSITTINVLFNEEFSREMINKLTWLYFQHVLPYLTLRLRSVYLC